MNEEINNIIEEMCNFVDNPTLGIKTKREKKLAGFMKSVIREFCARIEVAVAKTETTTSTCKDSLQVGDMAKMRQALDCVLAVQDAIELQRKPGRKIVCEEDATIFRCLDAIAEAQKIMQTIGKAG